MTRWSRTAAGAVLDLIYPRLCLVCGAPLRPDAVAVCGSCHERWTKLVGDRALEAELESRFVGQAPVGRVTALYRFDRGGQVQRLLHGIKYGGRTALARDLGRRLGAALLGDAELAGLSAVVPVPLHPAKRIERGFNQSEQLALGLAPALGVPVADLIRRTRHTPSQTGLDIDGRRRNLADAFALAVPPETVRDRSLLLVDDVLTTGATLAACARILFAAGAESVAIATVAATG